MVIGRGGCVWWGAGVVGVDGWRWWWSGDGGGAGWWLWVMNVGNDGVVVSGGHWVLVVGGGWSWWWWWWVMVVSASVCWSWVVVVVVVCGWCWYMCMMVFVVGGWWWCWDGYCEWWWLVVPDIVFYRPFGPLQPQWTLFGHYAPPVFFFPRENRSSTREKYQKKCPWKKKVPVKIFVNLCPWN